MEKYLFKSTDAFHIFYLNGDLIKLKGCDGPRDNGVTLQMLRNFVKNGADHFAAAAAGHPDTKMYMRFNNT